MAMLIAWRMIYSASLSSATLGKRFFALVQVDFLSIFFTVSSAHGNEKAQG